MRWTLHRLRKFFIRFQTVSDLPISIAAIFEEVLVEGISLRLNANMGRGGVQLGDSNLTAVKLRLGIFDLQLSCLFCFVKVW